MTSPWIKIGQDFNSWMERLEIYFDANVVRNKKVVSIFLTSIGRKSYVILKTHITTPKKPIELTFDELVKIVKDYLVSKLSVRAEHSKLRSSIQREGESAIQFVRPLQSLSRRVRIRYGVV